ncbi:putative nuclease HARBI1 [Brassica napus]|uniref:putative nuclease HARBI1 n=1 Tax=Brassica napus TaxID=3708 RepID=UPI00207A2478|nr:putative nuclease HARBI1 [Brassica napus]
MSSSSSDGVDEAVEEWFDEEFDNLVDSLVNDQAKNQRDGLTTKDIGKKDTINYGMTISGNMLHTHRKCLEDQRRNAHGRYGLSTLQKCTAAIRMLAYGQSGDTYDEYLRLGESTALLCSDNFTNAIIQLFGHEYLRRPTADDLQRLLDIGELRGFPGMVGIIDCMHWEWKNCPTAWRGQYTRGSGMPTIILEAVASHDLWIWHAFFGLPDTLNDINVLDRSPVFDDIIQGRTPKLFAQHQEAVRKDVDAVRKDVERAFGVLQARFAIVKNPALLWDKEKIGRIMRCCVILHNMIVEDERDRFTQYDTDEFESGESSRSSQVDVVSSTESLSNVGEMRGIRNQIRDQQIHHRLKADLVENIWQKFGNLDE